MNKRNNKWLKSLICLKKNKNNNKRIRLHKEFGNNKSKLKNQHKRKKVSNIQNLKINRQIKKMNKRRSLL